MYSLYKIVKADSTEELEFKVNELLDLLWEPIGGMVYNPNVACYLQTLGVDAGNHQAHIHRLHTQRIKRDFSQDNAPGMATGSW